MTRRIRVLVVEDAEQVRRSLVEMLEMEPDITVVGEAADGEEAVAMVADVRPDVVLMDINLPRMDGIAAAERILRDHDTRVIMISVENGPEYFRRAMQVGACDFLVKPFPRTPWPRRSAGRCRGRNRRPCLPPAGGGGG